MDNLLQVGPSGQLVGEDFLSALPVELSGDLSWEWELNPSIKLMRLSSEPIDYPTMAKGF
jgi:hypothetical protein